VSHKAGDESEMAKWKDAKASSGVPLRELENANSSVNADGKRGKSIRFCTYKLRKSILSPRQEPNTNYIGEKEEEKEQNSYDQREEASFFGCSKGKTSDTFERILRQLDPLHLIAFTSGHGVSRIASSTGNRRTGPCREFVVVLANILLAWLDAAIIGVRGLHGGTSLIEELV